jgi:hypothetical protein
MHHLDKNIGYEIWSIEKKRGCLTSQQSLNQRVMLSLLKSEEWIGFGNQFNVVDYFAAIASLANFDI